MRTMVPPCETPASPTDDLTRICVHDKTSQLFLDEKKNRYNAATFQWGTRDGLGKLGAQEEDSKGTQCLPLISTDVTNVIEKLQTLSCSEKECSRSRDCGDGMRTELLVSSKTPEPLNSKNMPTIILENNNNNNNKTEENNIKSVPSQNSETKAPTKRVRATHRRNLSLDFRAMGIELPPLSEVAPSVSPPRILHNIPESPVPSNHEAPPPSSAPAITPKIKHVVRRILSRRISRYE